MPRDGGGREDMFLPLNREGGYVWKERKRERERERKKFIDNQIDD